MVSLNDEITWDIDLFLDELFCRAEDPPPPLAQLLFFADDV